MRCIWSMIFCLMTSPLNASSLDRLGYSDLVILGESRLTVLFWDIYDARLYVTDGIYDPNKPFALALRYLRPFSGSDITERSVEEIRNQGSDDESVLTACESQLKAIFPDVVEGDQIVGISDPLEGARFFLNDSFIGTITDLNLSRRFFGIWLSEKTSEPELRKSLLGLGQK